MASVWPAVSFSQQALFGYVWLVNLIFKISFDTRYAEKSLYFFLAIVLYILLHTLVRKDQEMRKIIDFSRSVLFSRNLIKTEAREFKTQLEHYFNLATPWPTLDNLNRSPMLSPSMSTE